MKKCITILALITTPIALFAAIPVKNISDHCFCDLSGYMPHCRTKEEHPITAQFATGSAGSKEGNCVFNSYPIAAGNSGSTNYVDCDNKSKIIEWRDVNNRNDVYYTFANEGGTPSALDIITVQTVNKNNERMLVPLALNASLVVEKPSSCHLLLPSYAIKALL